MPTKVRDWNIKHLLYEGIPPIVIGLIIVRATLPIWYLNELAQVEIA